MVLDKTTGKQINGKRTVVRDAVPELKTLLELATSIVCRLL